MSSQFDHAMYLKVFTASGLTGEELAKLYNVSRTTLYAWRDTPPKSGSWNARSATIITEKLVTAMQKNILPLSHDLTKEYRAATLDVMVARAQKILT